MKKTPSKAATRHRFKSSMSVSQQVVCEDEACIGKSAGTPAAPTARAVQSASDSKRPASASGSITVGGKPACEDEACIGKK